MKWEPPDVAATKQRGGLIKKVLVLGLVVGGIGAAVVYGPQLIPSGSDAPEPEPSPTAVAKKTGPSKLKKRTPKHDPDFPPRLADDPLAGYLVASLKSGEWEAAERRLTETHALGRRRGGFTTHLDHLVARLIKIPAATEHFDAWAKARPKAFWPELVRGRWLLERGKLKSAKASLRRAAKRDPKSPYPGSALIRLANAQGASQKDRAVYLLWARRADRTYVQAYRNRLEGMRDVSARKALAFCETAVKENAGEPALKLLKIELLQWLASKAGGGRALRDAERKAIEADYRVLVKAFPKSPEITYARAQYARVVNRPAERGEWLGYAADAGSPAGMRYLSLAYYYGRYGLPKDHARSYKWARRAAEEGAHPQACGDVALALYKGRGVKTNVPAAHAWFRRGALWGNAYSMSWLGRLYTDGAEGVKKNPKRAIYWFRRAAKAGDEKAQKLMAKLLKDHPELKDAQ